MPSISNSTRQQHNIISSSIKTMAFSLACQFRKKIKNINHKKRIHHFNDHDNNDNMDDDYNDDDSCMLSSNDKRKMMKNTSKAVATTTTTVTAISTTGHNSNADETDTLVLKNVDWD